MVVTKGFRDDPHLDLLDEAQWRLEVHLNEEKWLEATQLVAVGFGWVTVFDPPWLYGIEFDEPVLTGWRVRQWHEDEDGEETDHARARIAVPELLDHVPARFHDWVLEVTGEALRGLEEGELESFESELDFDQRAALLGEISTLRGELAAARDRRQDLDRRRERFYGDIYLYEFSPETDLYWRLGTISDGTEALIIRPAEDSSDRSARVLIPPDELADWRWTEPAHPEHGGEYLSPAEVLAKAPPEFEGWVAARTHEALQRARHKLYELGSQTLVDAEDLARVARLARHAHRLAGFSRQSGISYPGAPDLEDEDHVAEASTPDGRTVLLFDRSWQHVLTGHPEMKDHLASVKKALEEPEHREPDVRMGRERFFARGGPESWLRVVIEMAGPIDRVVTAFPQAGPPERWRSA